MRDFFVFARRVLRDRAMLALALLFAVISAVGTGAGVLTLMPVVRLIIDDEGPSLRELARQQNASAESFLGVPLRIPGAILQRLPEDRLEGVMVVVGVLAVLTVLGATANYLHQSLSITVAVRAVARARQQLFEHALRLPLVRVGARGASEFVTRIIKDSADVQQGLIMLMSRAVADSLQGIALFVVALAVGRSITIAALLVLPPVAIFLRKIGKRIRRGTKGALEGQQQLLRLATESMQGLRAVKAHSAEPAVSRRFAEVNQQVVREELRARLARALSSPVIEAGAIIVVGGLVVLAAREIIAGRLSVERFVIALGALGLAGNKFKMLAGLINEVQAAGPPAGRVLDVLREAREPGAPDGVEAAAPAADRREAAKPALPRHHREIRLEGVRFGYPGAPGPALDGVDLVIPHGSRVAVVGPNGCGKTTMLGLLPRLLVPDAGRVLVDGHDLAEVDLASVRAQIAVVTQETVLFRGSIAENLRFGLGATEAPDDAIVAAAKAAHADEFIRALAGGYDADVSEQGSSLSGGQRQRLAIARAILRDPAILILDEATSQIDADSEARIAEAVNAFGRGRTVLVIAHRLATVIDSDLIVVMDEGRVVDQGTHAALLERCELYQRLSRTQLVGT